MNLKKKAISLGATDFGVSTVSNKRYYVIYNNKKINFGSKTGSTFIDHHDEAKKDAQSAKEQQMVNTSSHKLALKFSHPG